MQDMKMFWMHRDEFWDHFENGDPAHKIDYDGWCFFNITVAALQRKVGGIVPNRDLRGEADLPGPVSRWYGNLDEIPVILDFHHLHPRGEGVELHHGGRKDAREKIRTYFVNWGEKWLESGIA